MKVLFRFDASLALQQQLVARACHDIELLSCPESDDASYERLLLEIDVLWHVLKPVTAAAIARAPKLKLIQKIGSGVNTIDVEAAKRRGIAVCNLPGTNSRAVAEMALLLMLACLRRITQLDTFVREPHGWSSAWALQDHFGEIAGKTVGLIGYGAVARIVASILEAMGARVLYWSRSKSNAELQALVSTSDIISLHLPLTSETTHILDPRQMKRGAILVNTARGALVDEHRLLQALQDGHLAAAGLDVFASEPPSTSHALLTMPNVICSPHVAWLTRETLERSIAAAMENVTRLHDGLPLLNRVA